MPLLLALAALAMQAAPAAPVTAAAPTGEASDARCLAAFGILGSDAKAEVQQAAQMGALYFYGKLLGRNPAIDLRGSMSTAAQAVLPDIKPELQRCGTELQHSGEAMQAIGKAMEAETPAAAPTPAPAPAPARRKH